MPAPVLLPAPDLPADALEGLRTGLGGGLVDPARHVNYLGDDESPGELASAYGPNLARLRALEARYDPENVFRHKQNIRPAERETPA